MQAPPFKHGLESHALISTKELKNKVVVALAEIHPNISRSLHFIFILLASPPLPLYTLTLNMLL